MWISCLQVKEVSHAFKILWWCISKIKMRLIIQLVRHSRTDFVSILITVKTIPNNLCEFLARSKRSIMLLRFFDDASAWQHDDDDTGTSFNISHFHHKGSLLTSGPGGMVSKLVGTAESSLVENTVKSRARSKFWLVPCPRIFRLFRKGKFDPLA